MPRRKFAGKTDVGLKRKNNEDAFFISPDQHFCLAADGVGGAAAGELASKIFTESTIETFTDNSDRLANEGGDNAFIIKDLWHTTSLANNPAAVIQVFIS